MFSLRQRARSRQWLPCLRCLDEPQLAGSPVGAAIAGALLSRSVGADAARRGQLCLMGGFWPAVLPASSYEPTAEVRRRAEKRPGPHGRPGLSRQPTRVGRIVSRTSTGRRVHGVGQNRARQSPSVAAVSPCRSSESKIEVPHGPARYDVAEVPCAAQERAAADRPERVEGGLVAVGQGGTSQPDPEKMSQLFSDRRRRSRNWIFG